MAINITLHLKNKLLLMLCISCEILEVETHVKVHGRHFTQFIFITRVFCFQVHYFRCPNTRLPKINVFLAMYPFIFLNVPLFLHMQLLQSCSCAFLIVLISSGKN
jgi:hypothetical protein